MESFIDYDNMPELVDDMGNIYVIWTKVQPEVEETPIVYDEVKFDPYHNLIYPNFKPYENTIEFGKMIYYKTLLLSLDNKNEEFTTEIPINIDNSFNKSYDNLDENGIIKVGSIVKEGDCLIVKIRTSRTSKMHPSTKVDLLLQNSIIIDNSLYAKHNDVGIVESIKYEHRIISIKIKSEFDHNIGNKFSTRHAQMSTIGHVFDDMMPIFNE